MPVSQDLDAAHKLVRSNSMRKAGMIYLEHQASVYTSKSGRTYNIYASPVSLRGSPFPPFVYPQYSELQAAPFYSIGAFQYEAGNGRAIYDRIPPGTNILITHTPPFGECDVTKRKKRAGCPELTERLKHDDLQACRLHVYGHIHEAHGAMLAGRTERNPSGRISVNAALPSVPRPIIVDLQD